MPIQAQGKTRETVAMDNAGPWSTRKTSKTVPAANKKVSTQASLGWLPGIRLTK